MKSWGWGGEVQCSLVILQQTGILFREGGGTKRPCRFILSMETRISSSQMSLLALVHTLLNNSFYLNYNHSCYEDNIL